MPFRDSRFSNTHTGTWNTKRRNMCNISCFWKDLVTSKHIIWPTLDYELVMDARFLFNMTDGAHQYPSGLKILLVAIFQQAVMMWQLGKIGGDQDGSWAFQVLDWDRNDYNYETCTKHLMDSHLKTREDQAIWRWDKGGNFKVRSTYSRFIESGLTSTNARWIWKTNCPQKIRTFL